MGTWDLGPFDNDGALDFVAEAEESPAHAVKEALLEVVRAPAGEFLDVDLGAPCWAACELVALSFGRGDPETREDVMALAEALKPTEPLRLLALQALPRIGDKEHSELAGLWHDGKQGDRLDAKLAELRGRLEAAAAGPRTIAKPKAGDVIVLPDKEGWVVTQVTAAGEVAVFEGLCEAAESAFEWMQDRPARRVPTQVNVLVKQGRMLGNAPRRKELRGKKRYAGEMGFAFYFLTSAGGSGLEPASFEEALEHDLFERLTPKELVGLAREGLPAKRVRSPMAREAAYRAENRARWEQRRAESTVGPFGDRADLERLLEWTETTGLDNVIHQLGPDSGHGYGRPKEDAERTPYAFAGIVALWRGWKGEPWPSDLADRLPGPPTNEQLEAALRTARWVIEKVITPDAELRMMWEESADDGAALRAYVADLKAALAE